MNLYSGIKPFYFVCKLFGLAPISFKKHVTQDEFGVKSSILGTIHTVVVFLMILALVICDLKYELEVHYVDLSIALKITDGFGKYVAAFGSLLSLLLCAIRNRYMFVTILKKIQLIDRHVIDNPAKSIKSTRKFAFLQIIYFIILESIYVFRMCYFSRKDMDVNIYLSRCLVKAILSITLLQFLGVVWLVKQRLQLLNGALLGMFGNLTENEIDEESISGQRLSQAKHVFNRGKMISRVGSLMQESRFEYEEDLNLPSQLRTVEMLDLGRPGRIIQPEVNAVSLQNYARRLDLVRKLHGLLCDVSDLTSEAFGPQILTQVLLAFGSITSALYVAILTSFFVESDAKTEAENTLTVQFMTILEMCLSMIVLATFCHLAYQEAEKTTILVLKLCGPSRPQDVNKELQARIPSTLRDSWLKIFSHQLVHRKLLFSAYYFFPLDLTMLFSILGAVTTYLVILIQYAKEVALQIGSDSSVLPGLMLGFSPMNPQMYPEENNSYYQ